MPVLPVAFSSSFLFAFAFLSESASALGENVPSNKDKARPVVSR